MKCLFVSKLFMNVFWLGKEIYLNFKIHELLLLEKMARYGPGMGLTIFLKTEDDKLKRSHLLQK